MLYFPSFNSFINEELTPEQKETLNNRLERIEDQRENLKEKSDNNKKRERVTRDKISRLEDKLDKAKSDERKKLISKDIERANAELDVIFPQRETLELDAERLMLYKAQTENKLSA